MFEIDAIVDQLGESVTITDISTDAYNDRGDLIDDTGTEHTGSTAVVQIMDNSDAIVAEGILEPEDIIAWFKDDDTNVSYLKNGNKITYDSKVYFIKNTIKNNGHYEVHAKKESNS